MRLDSLRDIWAQDLYLNVHSSFLNNVNKFELYSEDELQTFKDFKQKCGMNNCFKSIKNEQKSWTDTSPKKIY